MDGDGARRLSAVDLFAGLSRSPHRVLETLIEEDGDGHYLWFSSSNGYSFHLRLECGAYNVYCSVEGTRLSDDALTGLTRGELNQLAGKLAQHVAEDRCFDGGGA